MKKNLALILMLVMLLSSLLAIVPAAEGEVEAPAEESYTPKITYSNLNYADKIYMMFAVPATTLAEGEAVKLIVWESKLDSIAFSYNDQMKDVLDPEAATVTIGGVEHYVFKYNKLAASQMTNVICTRPVLLRGDLPVAYGELEEYSILEYVVSAKGGIEGIAGLANTEALGLLDTLLDFGARAQQYAYDVEYDFYANDPVNKIYVSTVMNGVAKNDKTFASFFKYEEGETITFEAPFFDGKNVVKVTDAQGNEFVDLDDTTDGIQILPANGDLNLTVYYENVSVRALTAEELGPDYALNNTSTTSTSLGKSAKTNMSGVACTPDGANRMNYWHGFKTVADPEDPDNLVIMVTATNAPALHFNNTTAANWQGYGFGDTVYPAFTFEITLGAVNGKMPTTGRYYFRHRPGTQYYKYGVDLDIFTLENGEVRLPNGDVIGKIPETGMTKFAVSVDALTNEVYGYCENEQGEMVLTAVSEMKLSDPFLDMQSKHFKNLADEDPTNDNQFITYESIFTFFTKSSLEPTWVVGSGKATNPDFEALKLADGKYDMAAVQALAESDYSFLLDDFKLTLGFVYDR